MSNLIYEESGQSMIFGVLSVFIILFFGAMVLGVGRVTARRVQMQHAADSAAYAAAAVESESLNLLAATNTAMAQIRGKSLRYLADVYMYGTLKELRLKTMPENSEINEREAENRRLSEIADEINAELQDPDLDESRRETLQQRLVAIQTTLEINNERIAELQERLEERMQDFADQPQMRDPSDTIRNVGINRADIRYSEASEQAESWINAAGEWTRSLSRLQGAIAVLTPTLASEAVYRTATRQGAKYASVFPASRWLPRDDQYRQVRAERPAENCWIIEGGGEMIRVCRISHSEALNYASLSSFPAEFKRAWIVEWQRGTDSSRYLFVNMEDRRWYWEDLYTGESAYFQQTEDFQIVSWGPENVEVVEHNGYREIINTDGQWPDNTMFARFRDDTLEVAFPPHGSDENWEPRDSDFSALPPTSVDIDGVDVDIIIDPVIPLPGQAEIRVLDPAHLDLVNAAGERWARVHLREGSTYFTATINRVHVRVQEGRAGFRRRGERLWTNRENGLWRSHFDPIEQYWWQHRLTPLSGNRWLYEYEEEGGRLRRESNNIRLTSHQVIGGSPTNADGWIDPSVLPHWMYLEDETTLEDGWLDISRASWSSLLRNVSDDDFNYPFDMSGRSSYHQIRECWEPYCTDGLLPPLSEDEDAVPLECLTCEGEGYVLVCADELIGSTHTELPDVDLSFLGDDDYKPLVLNEEFLKHGVTVGVWRPRESHFRRSTGDYPDRPVEYLLHDPEPGMRGVMEGRGGTPRQRGERVRPAWGYFAVAAARPVLMEDDNRPAEPGAMQDGWFFSNPAVESGDRDKWLDDNMWNLYMVNSGGSWSYWDAALVPFNRQLLDADMRDLAGINAQSGTGWLMQRIAYGSPGGLVRTRQRDLPSWWGHHRHFGHVSGWASDIFGSYDQDYPPSRVRSYLLDQMRLRRPYPGQGGPYIDPTDSTLRDPLMEHFAEMRRHERGAQLDFELMRDEDVVH